MLNKNPYWFILIGIGVLSFLLNVKPTYAQNIILKKGYKLSSPPNYNYIKNSGNLYELTDGKLTSPKKSMWTQQGSVGWRNKNQISIDFDFESIQSVGSISFSTARRQDAGVYYPSHIFSFISNDGEIYRYIGDLMKGNKNLPGEYENKIFELENINRKARYLKMVIIAEGKFIFSDEIEVIKGTNVGIMTKIDQGEGFYVNDIQEIIDSIRRNEGLNNVNKTPSIKFNTASSHISFIINKVDAWKVIDKSYAPVETNSKLKYNPKVLVGGSQYLSFSITNKKTIPQSFFFEIDKNSFTKLELYSVPYVTINYSAIADPLRIVKNDIILEPNETKVFFIRVAGKKEGSFISNIIVNSKDDSRQKKEIEINLEVLDINMGNEKLNAINWGYLTYPMLKNREATAVNDMKYHHINTVVVPPDVIPKINESNFDRLIEYLTFFKGYEKVLLFTKFNAQYLREPDKSIRFMSTKWKQQYINWHKNMLLAIERIGFSSEQIYLYPYDEVKEKDINEFLVFLKWAKAGIPQFQSYATIESVNILNRLYPYLDIAQLWIRNNPKLEKKYGNLDIWIYDTKSGARGLSPYSYYRLMAWKAFSYDAKGVGFWNYAMIGLFRPENPIDAAFTNSGDDYAVVYTNGDEILSSKRWEAFKLGIEDYSIITIYSQMFGSEKALFYVRKVLSNPDDVILADEIRNFMLDEIKNK